MLLYEVMARELPYKGKDSCEIIVGVITKLLSRPTLTEAMAHKWPMQLQRLMHRALEENADDRPSMNEVMARDSLNHALHTCAIACVSCNIAFCARGPHHHTNLPVLHPYQHPPTPPSFLRFWTSSKNWRRNIIHDLATHPLRGRRHSLSLPIPFAPAFP